MSVKVLIADDHSIIRHGLVKLIEEDEMFEVVAESSDGQQAFNKIKELLPDIAVLDISMPKMTGLQIARKTVKEGLKTEFVILTMYRDEVYFNEAIEAGVKGYILKENSTMDLILALKTVHQGRSYISPLLSNSLLGVKSRKEKFIKENPTIENLSPTQRKILHLLSQNMTSKEIANKLNISARTVQNHRANICSIFGFTGTNKLLEFAIENKPNLSIK